MSLSRIIKEKALELGFVAVGIASPEPFQLYARGTGRPAGDVRMGKDSQPKGLGPGSGPHPLRGSSAPPSRREIPDRRDGQLLGGGFPALSLRQNRPLLFERPVLPRRNLPKRRRKEFREFLQGLGMKTIYGPAPARLAGARAGVTHYGRNCFAFANEAAGQSSWVVNEPYLVDRELEPDSPTLKLGCPENCRKCLDACPTGALYAPLKMDPRRCIAYLSYFTEGEIPRPIRPKMGTWVYGCDRCQEACPRNKKWMEKSKPMDETLTARAGRFSTRDPAPDMSQEHYEQKVGLCFTTSARKTAGSGSETPPWPWETWATRRKCRPLSTPSKIRSRSCAPMRSGPWESWEGRKLGQLLRRSGKPTRQEQVREEIEKTLEDS